MGNIDTTQVIVPCGGDGASVPEQKYRTDKLVPVITLVIFFGADEWD